VCHDGLIPQAASASVGTLRFRPTILQWVAAILLAASRTSAVADGTDRWWGPLFTESGLTLSPGRGEEAFGPLWGTEETGEISLWRLSPLASGVREPDLERTEWEFLYPIATYDRFGSEWRLQIFQMLSFSGSETLDGEVKRRQTLFPLYFRQQTTAGTNDYLAVIPFYGHLRNRLFRDEVKFILVPLWAQTRKKGVTTDNYLLPFFHVRHGGGVEGWQFWPVIGSETKVPTLRTNVLDEPEPVPGHRRDFFAWPIFFRETTGIGGANPATNLYAFPVYLRTRSPAMDYDWWMFFSHRTNRVGKFEEWAAPWPFIGRARGPGKRALRFWPVWGHATSGTLTSDFLAWPFYVHKKLDSPPLERERHRILYFAYSNLREEDMETGRAFRRRDLWPFFTWRHEKDGRERLQVLAPIEGLLPHNKSIERLYSPIWSVWRQESNPATQSRSQSLLWNLWRREQKPDHTRTSLLFGAVQTSKPTGNRRSWRILGFGPRPTPPPDIPDPAATHPEPSKAAQVGQKPRHLLVFSRH
jgi:hypothetical protein